MEYHLISTKDQSRIHQFGKKVLPGIFLGYYLYAGRIWKGDILVVDVEELEEIDASEIHAERLNAKEVILPESVEKYKFRIADGTVKPCGGDQALRTSTLILNQPVRIESHQDFLGESEGSAPPNIFKTHFWMPVQHEMISGPFRETAYTAITLNQESNSTRRGMHHFLFH